MSKAGKIIKEKRAELKLSQEDITSFLKFSSPQYISNIERGVSPLPAKHVKKISNLLQIPSQLLENAAIEDLSDKYRKKVRNGFSKGKIRR